MGLFWAAGAAGLLPLREFDPRVVHMPQPEDDPKSAALKERRKYSTDQLMNQFCKMESGGLGRSPEYRRGHEWNFVWCADPPWRQGRPKLVKKVYALMEQGKSFEEAFDEVAYHEQTHRDGT